MAHVLLLRKLLEGLRFAFLYSGRMGHKLCVTVPGRECTTSLVVLVLRSDISLLFSCKL